MVAGGLGRWPHCSDPLLSCLPYTPNCIGTLYGCQGTPYAEGMSDRLNRLQKELEAISNPEDRAKALSDVLSGLPDFQKALRELRQSALTDLHLNQGMSFGQIGSLIGVSRGRAKQIVDGQTVSGRYLKKVEPVDGESEPA